MACFPLSKLPHHFIFMLFLLVFKFLVYNSKISIRRKITQLGCRHGRRWHGRLCEENEMEIKVCCMEGMYVCAEIRLGCMAGP